MCHLILLMPVLALPLFWVLPIPVAVPVYTVVLVVSGWVYWLALRAMHRPVQTGREALLHETGFVIGKENGVLRVRVHSEIWTAESTDDLSPGDAIEVVSEHDMQLKVRRLGGADSVDLIQR